MLSALRTSAVARAAAALLALALSGAPRAAETLRPEKPHRCQCRHGAGERCTCPVCAARVRKAKRNGLAELPACRRAAAEQALAAEEEHERRDRDVPCVQGDCGSKDPLSPPRASAETFTLPDPPVIGRAALSGVAAVVSRSDGVAAPVPEPPPPRAG